MARLWELYLDFDDWLYEELEREVIQPLGKLYAALLVGWWVWPLMLTAVGR